MFVKSLNVNLNRGTSTKSYNQATLEAYNKEVASYVHNTPHKYTEHHAPLLRWIDHALTGLRGKNVLEIGSATPRDAVHIRSKGFTVQTSDASEKFLHFLRSNGEEAILLNALTDPIPTGYDLIYANAVAPHFTRHELLTFLCKIEQALSQGSRLAFSLKMGTGEEWIKEKFDTKRFIHYWQPDDIKQLLAQLKFKIIFFETNFIGDLPNHHWINITIEKQ